MSADVAPPEIVAGAVTDAISRRIITRGFHGASAVLAGVPASFASDIYALGATLQNLLTGHPPSAEPGETDPSTSVIPQALAAVCRKAMAPDPVRRYPGPAALAEDVNAWLIGERVDAHQEPWRETVWRWASRHRTPVGIAAALLLAVAIVGPLAFFRERQLRAQAESASVRADRERQTADVERRRALVVLDEIIAQAETIGSLQSSLPAAKVVLDRVVRHIEELARDAESDPARRAFVADKYFRAGRIRFKLHQLPEAENAFSKAAPLLEERIRQDPADSSSRHRLAMCWREWGVTLATQGRAKQAKPLWKRAVQVLEPIASAEPDYRHTLSKVYMVIGNVSMSSGEPLAAQEAFEHGRALASRLVADRPNAAAYRFTLADIRNNQGMLFMGEAVSLDGAVVSPAKLRASQAAHREALELRRQLVQGEPGNPDYLTYLAASFNHLGNTFNLQGENGFAEAEANYREALALLEPLAVAFPGVPSHRQEMAEIYNNLNELLVKQKRLTEAEVLARRAVDDFTRLERHFPAIPEHPAELGVALGRLAKTLRLQGKTAAANDHDYAAAIAIGRASALLLSDPPQREVLASQVIALLQRLAAEGFFRDPRNIERLQKEPALQSLRSRPDYAKLLDALNRK